MRFDPQRHHRHALRLPGYDYARPGSYFVTVCAQQRASLFGEIHHGQMALNEAGQMVARWWAQLPHEFPSVQTDAYVVMPNHFHGVVIIVGTRARDVGADLCVRPNEKGAHVGAPLQRIIQWFKTMTTNEYIRGVKEGRWPSFPGRLWQRGYYDHIIRDEDEWDRIRAYIEGNPAQWEMDVENPNRAVQPQQKGGSYGPQEA